MAGRVMEGVYPTPRASVLLFSIMAVAALVAPSAVVAEDVRYPTLGTIPAEFEPVSSVVVSWPGEARSLYKFYADLVGSAKVSARVQIVVENLDEAAVARTYLESTGVSGEGIDYLYMKTDTIWIRDYGPVPLLSSDGDLALADLYYYMPRQLDDALPYEYARAFGLEVTALPLSIEGGNLMGMGEILLTTSHIYAENDFISPSTVDSMLASAFSVRRVVALEPLIGEGTGHVDMFARVALPDTVIVAQFPPGDSNSEVMERNAAVLSQLRAPDGSQVRVTRVPMGKGFRTYTNSLIVNDRVLVPTYGLSTDAAALAAYREAFAGKTIVPIDSSSIVGMGGAIHCVALTIPAIGDVDERFEAYDANEPAVPLLQQDSALRLVAVNRISIGERVHVERMLRATGLMREQVGMMIINRYFVSRKEEKEKSAKTSLPVERAAFDGVSSKKAGNVIVNAYGGEPSIDPSSIALGRRPLGRVMFVLNRYVIEREKKEEKHISVIDQYFTGDSVDATFDYRRGRDRVCSNSFEVVNLYAAGRDVSARARVELGWRERRDCSLVLNIFAAGRRLDVAVKKEIDEMKRERSRMIVNIFASGERALFRPTALREKERRLSSVSLMRRYAVAGEVRYRPLIMMSHEKRDKSLMVISRRAVADRMDFRPKFFGDHVWRASSLMVIRRRALAGDLDYRPVFEFKGTRIKDSILALRRMAFADTMVFEPYAKRKSGGTERLKLFREKDYYSGFGLTPPVGGGSLGRRLVVLSRYARSERSLDAREKVRMREAASSAPAPSGTMQGDIEVIKRYEEAPFLSERRRLDFTSPPNGTILAVERYAGGTDANLERRLNMELNGRPDGGITSIARYVSTRSLKKERDANFAVEDLQPRSCCREEFRRRTLTDNVDLRRYAGLRRPVTYQVTERFKEDVVYTTPGHKYVDRQRQPGPLCPEKNIPANLRPRIAVSGSGRRFMHAE